VAHFDSDALVVVRSPTGEEHFATPSMVGRLPGSSLVLDLVLETADVHKHSTVQLQQGQEQLEQEQLEQLEQEQLEQQQQQHWRQYHHSGTYQRHHLKQPGVSSVEQASTRVSEAVLSLPPWDEEETALLASLDDESCQGGAAAENGAGEDALDRDAKSKCTVQSVAGSLADSQASKLLEQVQEGVQSSKACLSPSFADIARRRNADSMAPEEGLGSGSRLAAQAPADTMSRQSSDATANTAAPGQVTLQGSLSSTPANFRHGPSRTVANQGGAGARVGAIQDALAEQCVARLRMATAHTGVPRLSLAMAAGALEDIPQCREVGGLQQFQVALTAAPACFLGSGMRFAAGFRFSPPS
jgi:hypothetical protein